MKNRDQLDLPPLVTKEEFDFANPATVIPAIRIAQQFLLPTDQARLGAALWTSVANSTLAEAGSEMRFPADPLRVFPKAVVNFTHTALDHTAKLYVAYSTYERAEELNANAWENAALATGATWSAFNVGGHLGQTFLTTPVTGSIVKRAAGVFARSSVIGNALYPIVDAPIHYLALRETHSTPIAATSALIGAGVGTGAGALALTLFEMGLVTPPPGNLALFGAGAIALYASPSIGEITAHQTADYLTHALSDDQSGAANRGYNSVLENELIQELENDARVARCDQITSITSALLNDSRQKLREIDRESTAAIKAKQKVKEKSKAKEKDSKPAPNASKPVASAALPPNADPTFEFIKEFTAAFTTVDAKGFEGVPKIEKLKKEYASLVLAKAAPHELLAQAAKVKEAQVEVLLSREAFAEKFQHGRNAVNGLAALAAMGGHDRFAQQVSIIGNQGFKAVETLIGIFGNGEMVAKLSMAAATGNLIECIPALVSLFQKKKQDPMQQLSIQIKDMMHTMQMLFKEVFARLEGIERSLNEIQYKSLQYYLSLDFNQALHDEKLDIMDAKRERSDRTLGDLAASSLELLEAAQKVHANERTNDATRVIQREVKESVTLAATTKTPGQDYYDKALAKIVTYSETPDEGITHRDLIGIASDPAVMADPVLAFGLLQERYCHKVRKDECAASVDSVFQALKKVASKIPSIHLTTVVQSYHLITQQPNHKSYRVDSLVTYLDEKNNQNKLVVVPIYIQARWSLLLVDLNKREAIFVGLPHSQEVQRVQQALETLQLKSFKSLMIASPVFPATSHYWIIRALQQLDPAKLSESLQRMLQVNPVAPSLDEKSLTPTEFTPEELTPINPLLMAFLGFNLLKIMEKRYPVDFKEAPNISAVEIKALVDFLKLIDKHHQMQAQFYRPPFIASLVDDCIASGENLEKAIATDQAAFEKQVTDEINLDVKKVLKNYLDVATLSQFNTIDCDFPLYGNWWQGRYQTISAKRGVVGEADHRNPCGQDAIYRQNRKTEIEAVKRNHVINSQSGLANIKLVNHFSMTGDCKAEATMLPPFIVPRNPKLPFLRMTPKLLSYLAADVSSLANQLMFGLGVGKLEITYEIVSSPSAKMIFNIHYNDDAKSIPLARLSVDHQPKFYQPWEAVYNDYEGGCYVAESTATSYEKVGVKPTEGYVNNDHFFGYVPKPAQQAGLFSKIGQSIIPVDLLDKKSDAHQANLNYLSAKIAETKKKYQDRYEVEYALRVKAGELQKCVKQHASAIGLLKLYLKLILPPKEFEDKQSFIHALFAANNHSQKELLKQLKVMLPDLIERNAFARNQVLDMLQHYLLDTLNQLTPHLKQVPTVTQLEKVFEKASEILGKRLAGLVSYMKRHVRSPEKMEFALELMEVGGSLTESLREARSSGGALPEPLRVTFERFVGDSGRLLLTGDAKAADLQSLAHSSLYAPSGGGAQAAAKPKEDLVAVSFTPN